MAQIIIELKAKKAQNEKNFCGKLQTVPIDLITQFSESEPSKKLLRKKSFTERRYIRSN